MPPIASPQELLAIARAWKGTPFQHQGRLRGVGVDCIGLVIEVYREGGILAALGLPERWNYTGYGRQAAGNVLETLVGKYLVKLPGQFPDGSIGLFRLGSGLVTHSGLLFHDGNDARMIHAYNSLGKNRFCVQEHGFRGAWRQRCQAIYGLPEERHAWPEQA